MSFHESKEMSLAALNPVGQYRIVKLVDKNLVDISIAGSDTSLGITHTETNRPNRAIKVRTYGNGYVVVGAGVTISINDRITSDALGAATIATATDFVIGSAMNNGVAGDIIELMIDPQAGGSGLGPVQNMICDTDMDTCVEVERTADDDTVRGKAAGLDFLTGTSTNFDIFGGVDINLTRGDFTIFNDATGLSGNDTVGHVWTSGTETMTQYTDSDNTSSQIVYNNTVGNVVNQLKVNDTTSILTASGTGYVNIIAANTTGTSTTSSDGVSSTAITTTPDTANIDVEEGTFFLNEGTTDSGSGVATPGQVLTLVDETTGEAEYADIALSTYSINQATAGTTTIANGSPVLTTATVVFDTELTANADFTLNPATGVVTVNKTGTYRIEKNINMNSLVSGGNGSYIFQLKINGGFTSDFIRQRYFHSNEYQMDTWTGQHSFTAGDTFQVDIIQGGGTRGVTNQAFVNKLIVTEL